MKKIIAYLMLIVGIALIVKEYSSAMAYLLGGKVSLNTTTSADLDEKAAAEGDVMIALGPFCRNEGQKIAFGIPAGKCAWDYYLVCTADPEQMKNALIRREKNNVLSVWYVARIEDEDTKAAIAASNEEMGGWLSRFRELLEPEDGKTVADMAEQLVSDMPECRVHLRGQLVDMDDSANFVQIRDKYIAETKIASGKIGAKMFVEEGVGLLDVVLFFAGIALVIAHIILRLIPDAQRADIAL